MLQQFVGLVLCGLAVVARDRDVQIIGQHIPVQRVDPFQHTFRNGCRVRAFALGQCDRDCGIICSGCLARTTAGVGEQDIVVRLGRAVLQLLHNIAQIDRTARVDSNDDLLQILRTREEFPCFDLELAVIARKTSRLSTAVRGLELIRDCRRRETIGGQPLRIQNHSYLTGLSADNHAFRKHHRAA